MFELPGAKRFVPPSLLRARIQPSQAQLRSVQFYSVQLANRHTPLSVRRSELFTRSSSSSRSPSPPDPELAEVYHARLASIYGLTTAVAPVVVDGRGRDGREQAEDNGAGERDIRKGQKDNEEGDKEEGIFEFRLFSSLTPQPITLQDEDTSTGVFLPGRDNRIFIVGRAQGEERRRFQHSAMRGEDVLTRSRSRAWGLEVPWRVAMITEGRRRRGDLEGRTRRLGEELVLISGEGKRAGDIGERVIGEEKGEKRRRPGKKRRIVLRMRAKSVKEAAERRRVEAAQRDEAEREKRTRRNREKKVKRKMKAKAKKGDDGGEGDGDGDALEGDG